jgi:hypothetical protein
MTGTTEIVKVTEIGFSLEVSKKQFEIDPSGRTTALKVDYEDGEYELFILYENVFRKTLFEYESTMLRYFKSNKIDQLMYVETFKMVADDNHYINATTGRRVEAEKALDGEGNLNPGYFTEAQFYEAQLGPTISGAEINGIKRTFGLE